MLLDHSIQKQLFELEKISETLKLNRWEQKERLIKNAEITAATCSGFAMAKNEIISADDFHTVIIEEAGKVTEAESIFLFGKNTKRIILLGDDLQMRSIIFHHQLISHSQFDQPLLSRFLRLNIPFYQLNYQTRALPEVCFFFQFFLFFFSFYFSRLRTCIGGVTWT